jgi:tetratricopeptide (TPR) repeat protein
VVAAAVVVRLVYALGYFSSPLSGIFMVDQLFYRSWAIRIARGMWLGEDVFPQGPFYAYLLGGLYRVLGIRNEAVLPVQMLGGVVTAGLVWWCARSLYGKRAALAAGLFAAAFGPFVFYECMIMKTFLEPLLAAAALAAALRGTETARARWYALSGAAIGLACLVREVHVLLLSPLLAAAWFAESPHPDPGAKRRLAAAGAALAAFCLSMAPATLHNWIVSRTFVASTAGGGEAFYLAFGPQNAGGYYRAPDFVRPRPFLEHQDFREEAFFRTRTPMSRNESSRYWYREGWEALVREPGRVARSVALKARVFFHDAEIPDSESYTATAAVIPPLRYLPTFGLFAGLGALGAWLSLKRGGRALLPLGFAAVLFAEVLLTYNFGRFRAAFCGVWLILAGEGAAWLSSSARRAGRANGLAAACAAAGVLLLAVLSFRPPPESGSWLPQHGAAIRSNLEMLAGRLAAIREMRAAAAGRESPELLRSLGESLEDTGRYDEAIAVYEDMLRRSPGDAETRRNLVRLFSWMGEYDRAAAQAGLLLDAFPSDAENLYLAGVVASRQGSSTADAALSARRLARAETLLRAALAAAPDAPAVRYQLGRVLHLRGDDRAAVRELIRVQELVPDFPGVARDLGLIVESGAVPGYGRP